MTVIEVERVAERHKVVLIVEDGAATRRSIERVVGQAYIPVGCASFEEALVALDQMRKRPLALIVDVHLGAGARGDGLDVAKHAHDRFGGYIPTLVITGGVPLPEMTQRAHQLRAEFLVKPQSPDTLRLFLQRADVKDTWAVADVLDLDRAIAEFAKTYALTERQVELLVIMMTAAERGEHPELNENTRKAAIRRILAKTGHASFEKLRIAIKQFARGEADDGRKS